jgi:hypothetical protein
MAWTCIERGSGYCNGEPDFAVLPKTIELRGKDGNPTGETYTIGAVCKRKHDTCDRYLVAKKEDMEGHGSGIKQTIIKPEKVEPSISKKTGKKEKSESQQLGMFQ